MCCLTNLLIMSSTDATLPEMPSATVLSSCSLVAGNSINVQIDDDAITQLAVRLIKPIREGKIGAHTWHDAEMHPGKRGESDEAIAEWIFFADSLNFSFWTDPNAVDSKCGILRAGNLYTGYFALCAAMNRHLEERKSARFDCADYGHWSRDQFEEIFRSDTSIAMPMADERFKTLKETSDALNQHYNGSVVNLIKAAKGSAQTLLRLLLCHFPSYRDVSPYRLRDGRLIDVYFLKRAQILVADLWAAFDGVGLGRFDDIDRVTMFADYRIPQALAYLGVLQYSPDLRSRLDEKHLFHHDDKEEVEIRACSIVAVDRLKRRLLELMMSGDAAECKAVINGITLDYHLWFYRRENASSVDQVPFHRVRCIYY